MKKFKISFRFMRGTKMQNKLKTKKPALLNFKKITFFAQCNTSWILYNLAWLIKIIKALLDLMLFSIPLKWKFRNNTLYGNDS